jgi:hypothetical protein
VPLETTQIDPQRLAGCPHFRLRQQIRELASLIVETCPVSDDRTEALRHLDAVAFYAVASRRYDHG